MTNPLFYKENILLVVFAFISLLPTLLYVAFKTKDDGSAGGIVGYYLIKWIRWLR